MEKKISLKKFLKTSGYTRIPLTRTKTNHFELRAEINGVKGRFIMDTGASNTFVGLDCVEQFNLQAEKTEVKAAGAGGRGMETQLSKKNHIKIGKWEHKKAPIILFNMIHVNAALLEYKATPVNGIIGADILKKGKAIIDYDKCCIFLKTE